MLFNLLKIVTSLWLDLVIYLWQHTLLCHRDFVQKSTTPPFLHKSILLQGISSALINSKATHWELSDSVNAHSTCLVYGRFIASLWLIHQISLQGLTATPRLEQCSRLSLPRLREPSVEGYSSRHSGYWASLLRFYHISKEYHG